MKPTPEDYSISPEEALEINAKSTQGHWQAYGYVGRASGHERYGNVAGLPRVQVDRDAMFTPEDAAAIAWWHNNGPAIARRLIELEKAARSYVKTIYPPSNNMPVLVSAMALSELIDVLDRTKKGHENAKAN